MSDRTGWIVCVACVINIFCRGGVVYGFGSFIAELKQLYHTPMAELGKLNSYFIVKQNIMLNNQSFTTDFLYNFFIKLLNRINFFNIFRLYKHVY